MVPQGNWERTYHFVGFWERENEILREKRGLRETIFIKTDVVAVINFYFDLFLKMKNILIKNVKFKV